MIRPEVAAALRRWQEVIAAGAVLAAGLWLAWLGGWLLLPLGLLVAAAGLGLGWQGLRRMRFARGAQAPGLVEFDEAQIAYLGPESGGFVSLAELAEIRLVTLAGRPHWRLKQADGQALLVPVDAAGAAALHDAFAVLPGIELGRLAAALQAGPDDGAAAPGLPPPLWRRPPAGRIGRA
ncbi:hypothetical protein [Frigidibacter oleivorans]|uniref:hypothetical protein n=1 Tax=Frigidibacter oleivorans TaxID=2487129 RepID=UPI00197AE8DE|nr:hypothetical protein [Frigidibacter oleivorans]